VKLTQEEHEFLSVWAREEWEPACYQLPAHRLQLLHGVSGARLIVLIKAWTEREGKKDSDIIDKAVSSQLLWPWPTKEDFDDRFAEASHWRTRREGLKKGSEVEGVEAT
jgi:hypothetical protein